MDRYARQTVESTSPQIYPEQSAPVTRLKYSDFKFLVMSDLYRYAGNKNIKAFLKNWLANPGFKYTFWMRSCAYFKQHHVLRYGFFHVARLLLQRYTYKYGISIPYVTQIGSGFYIGHFGGIVVNENAVLGKNCNISHGVTLGQANRGKHKGYPVVGHNVYIGPGAKIIGNVRIGDNAAVGANCVVTQDVPDNAVVVGIPAKVISFNGSEGYVNKTNY